MSTDTDANGRFRQRPPSPGMATTFRHHQSAACHPHHPPARCHPTPRSGVTSRQGNTHSHLAGLSGYATTQRRVALVAGLDDPAVMGQPVRSAVVILASPNTEATRRTARLVVTMTERRLFCPLPVDHRIQPASLVFRDVRERGLPCTGDHRTQSSRTLQRTLRTVVKHQRAQALDTSETRTF